jgi:CBS domain-containing protein
LQLELVARPETVPVETLRLFQTIAEPVLGHLAASTTARLRAAEEAGTLAAADAAVLRDAFELTCALRMEHQVEQLRAGEAPDNLIDPKRLTPLTRTSLKDAFRAVAKVQRGIGAKQGFTWR